MIRVLEASWVVLVLTLLIVALVVYTRANARNHAFLEGDGWPGELVDDEPLTWPGNDGRRLDYDPTHGRIDHDIQEHVDRMGVTSLGQRVAIESTIQSMRDAGRPVVLSEARR